MNRSALGTNFRRIWVATTISNLGDGVTLAAMPLLAASLTRSPTSVSTVFLAGSLPWMFFALLGGAAADRFDRRRIMVLVDVVRAVAIAGIGVAVLLDAESIVLLAVVNFALGTAECFFDTSSQAILPNVVPTESLETANGRIMAAETVANQFAGPPLGSFVFVAAAAAPFFVDAASFGLAALLVFMMRGQFRPERPAGPPRSVFGDIGEGLRWLWHHRLFRTLAIALGIMNLFETATLSIFVLYALESLGLTKAQYGLLLTAGALGAVAGSLVASRVSARIGPGRVLQVAMATFGVQLLVPGLIVSVWAVVPAFVVGGALVIGWNVVTVSLRQALIPDHLLGRVNSAYRLVGWGTMPIGALLGGLVADAFGLRAPFLLGGAAVLATTIVVAPFIGNRAITQAQHDASPTTPFSSV